MRIPNPKVKWVTAALLGALAASLHAQPMRWRGDFVYFATHVPHQEFNPDEHEAVEFVVVRSDNERIVVALDDRPIERPEKVY